MQIDVEHTQLAKMKWSGATVSYAVGGSAYVLTRPDLQRIELGDTRTNARRILHDLLRNAR